jgi:hypothetical protein
MTHSQFSDMRAQRFSFFASTFDSIRTHDNIASAQISGGEAAIDLGTKANRRQQQIRTSVNCCLAAALIARASVKPVGQRGFLGLPYFS